MLPQDFWAGLAGDLVSTLFGGFMTLFLTPLTALTNGMLAFFAQFLPK